MWVKIKNWFKTNILVKTILVVLLELFKIVFKAFLIWITGLFLIQFLAGLPFISFTQSIFLSLWFKIIFFNLSPKEIKF